MQGHGLSDGLHGYITDLRVTAGDYSDFFEKQLAQKSLRALPFFLYGVSMGGALCFNQVTLPDCSINKLVKGVILSAPMIKINPDFKPPEVVINALIKVSDMIPYAPITPTADLIDKCFKKPEQVARARASKLSYHGQPRLKSGLACLDAMADIEKRMQDLIHPCLILHGDADQVTSWKVDNIMYCTVYMYFYRPNTSCV